MSALKMLNVHTGMDCCCSVCWLPNSMLTGLLSNTFWA